MQRTLNIALNAVTLAGGNQGPHIGIFTGGIANTNPFDLLDKRLEECVVDAILHIDTRGSSTVLATVDVSTNNGPIGRGLEVSIGVNDKRGFPPSSRWTRLILSEAARMTYFPLRYFQ